MRPTALLFLIAASAAAQDEPLTLEDLGRGDSPASENHLFLLRTGVQSLSSDLGLSFNADPYTLDEGKGNRFHVDALLELQPYRMRPGLVLGLGLSRTYWGLGGDVGLTARHLDVIGGLVMPLTPSNTWRVELLGYVGAGQATLGDGAASSASTETGVDVGLVFPVYKPWRLEGGITAGWYWSRSESLDLDVVKSGSVIPVTIEVSPDAMAYGLSLTWRP